MRVAVVAIQNQPTMCDTDDLPVYLVVYNSDPQSCTHIHAATTSIPYREDGVCSHVTNKQPVHQSCDLFILSKYTVKARYRYYK